MRYRNILTVALVSCILAGCSITQLTPDGREVRITEKLDVVENCRFIDTVSVSDSYGGGMINVTTSETNATHKLQNATAKIGGDTVYITSYYAGYWGADIEGKAYLCQK